MKVIFVVLVAIAFAQAQFVDRFLIDDFTVGADNHSIEVKLTADIVLGGTPIIQTSAFDSAGCSGLLGCSRFMKVTVFVGLKDRKFTSDIFSITNNKFGFVAEWAISSPKNSKSSTSLTYDGANGNATLNVNGLGTIDFTDGGNAIGLRFSIVSDLPAVYSIDIYSNNGGLCAGKLNFPANVVNYTRSDIDRDIAYSAFSKGCDLTKVGAVVLTVPSDDAVDALIRQISVYGNPNPTPTPSISLSPTITTTPSKSFVISDSPSASITPTPTITSSPGPSISSTPTQTPTPTATITGTPTPTPTSTGTSTSTPTSTSSPSMTPSRTPSPSGPCIQYCTCPSFTCALAFDRDDDENDVLLNPPASIFFGVPHKSNQPIEIIREIPGPIRYVYIYVDEPNAPAPGPGNTFTIPTFTIPTFTVPTFTIPTFTIPTFTFPTFTVPAPPSGNSASRTPSRTPSKDSSATRNANGNGNGNGNASSSASTLVSSIFIVAVVALI